jgi:hypothetical protein
MPSFASPARDGHGQGDFGDTGYERVQASLAGLERVEFHRGIIPETLKPVADSKFCFVHVDVDIYQTTADCCAFFYPRLSPGGVMICDDYGFYRYRDAAKLAMDEYFRDKPEPVISLRTGQGMVIKQ